VKIFKTKEEREQHEMWKKLSTPPLTEAQKEWKLLSSIFLSMKQPTKNTGPR